MANKEHIYQFAVSIDEEAIVNRIVNNLEKEMKNEIKKQVESVMRDRWGDPKQWVKDCIAANYDKDKDTIVENTSKLLVEKLYRTKAVKEMIKRVEGEVLNDGSV